MTAGGGNHLKMRRIRDVSVCSATGKEGRVPAKLLDSWREIHGLDCFVFRSAEGKTLREKNLEKTAETKNLAATTLVMLDLGPWIFFSHRPPKIEKSAAPHHQNTKPSNHPKNEATRDRTRYRRQPKKRWRDTPQEEKKVARQEE